MINRLLVAVVMGAALGACAGADEVASDDDASASAPDAATTDVAPATPATTERTIPLCDGSPPESPELCQRLVYGTHGYCNQWIDCSSLH